MKKSILITGCSYGGIGYVCAKTLYEMGFLVVATARKKEDVLLLKQEGLNAYVMDIRDQKSIKKALKKTLKLTNNSLDALFNNAGYGQLGAIEDLSIKDLKNQLDTNLFGYHRVIKEVLPIMYAQGYGKIINHSSILGLVSLKFRGAYQISKYAIEAYSDTLSLELEGSGISLSLLNTGPVESLFRQNAINNFYNTIDRSNSRFKYIYIDKIDNRKSSSFSLPASSVADIVHQILLSSNPKPRYYITKASYILAFAKRVLSTKLFRKLCLTISNKE